MDLAPAHHPRRIRDSVGIRGGVPRQFQHAVTDAAQAVGAAPVGGIGDQVGVRRLVGGAQVQRLAGDAAELAVGDQLVVEVGGLDGVAFAVVEWDHQPQRAVVGARAAGIGQRAGDAGGAIDDLARRDRRAQRLLAGLRLRHRLAGAVVAQRAAQRRNDERLARGEKHAFHERGANHGVGRHLHASRDDRADHGFGHFRPSTPRWRGGAADRPRHRTPGRRCGRPCRCQRSGTCPAHRRA